MCTWLTLLMLGCVLQGLLWLTASVLQPLDKSQELCWAGSATNGPVLHTHGG